MASISITREISSSSATPKWTYDVFLSFRGEDVRKNFVGFLYSALQQKGIHTFKDDERLERGRAISPALSKAIEESRIALVIFSENYASSTWCLDELVKIIECKNLLGQTVVPVFYYVEPSVVRKQKESFRKAFDTHEATFDKEKVESWRGALVEAANLSGWDVQSTANGHEYKCVQQIVGDIMGKLFLTESTGAEDLVGIESQQQKIISLLNMERDDVRFLGIWGMSGIGKTTIARAVFKRISNHFEAASFLHEVGDNSRRHGFAHLQQKLLSETLGVTDLRINNVYEGIDMTKRRLCYKRVLIVLDDIDHQEQLDALAGKHDWFGAGSKIIITTRNKHLLVEQEVDRMYRMQLLDEYEGMQLFRMYAFRKMHHAEDYQKFSTQIIRYAGGLPLALKVLGSFLCGRGMDEWRSEVERLKTIREDDIVEKLKVSLDGLKDIEKEIFLDIACFFQGKKKKSVAKILDSFNFYPDIGIKVLIEKSLLTVSRGRLLMHQLIQEMGWQIVCRKALKEPGKRSRLWVAEDICHLLATEMVTQIRTEGIWLDLSTSRDVTINNEVFKKMNKLRLLKVYNACLSQGPDHIPNAIRWLNWHGYPSKSLPSSFLPEMLVGLKMKHSHIVQLWRGIKILDKLKFINLSFSQKLVRTPDFTGIPNLQRLILVDCVSLVEIHPSAGFLKRLQLFNVRGCTNLRSIPKRILLEKLEVFILSGCTNLDKFPEIMGPMNCLSEVYLEATAIKELPSSIEHLSSLVLLNLSYCKDLMSLPSSICRLKCLKALILSSCSKLDKLPEELGNAESLEELRGDETSILQPPSSIVLLKNLKTLTFSGCKGMALRTWRAYLSSWLFSRKHQGLVIPCISGLRSLAKLDLSDCNMLDGGLPCDLGSLSSLEELNLSRNNFVSISAASVKSLCNLRILELVGCKRLMSLPDLPQNIEEVYGDDCTSLQSDTDLFLKYERLYRVSFTNCFQLFRTEQASTTVDAIWKQLLKGLLLVDDCFSICIPGRDIPKWFSKQNTGSSISIELPPNWYNHGFMGFAICVVSDLISTSSVSEAYLQQIPGIVVQLKIKTWDSEESTYITTICKIGAEKEVDLEHICLAYVPFHQLWSSYEKTVYSPNDWCQIVASGVESGEQMVLKTWGICLVYEEDVKTNDERSSESRKMGLSGATFNGSQYVKKKRRGYHKFSRLPPEIMTPGFGNQDKWFEMNNRHSNGMPFITVDVNAHEQIQFFTPHWMTRNFIVS